MVFEKTKIHKAIEKTKNHAYKTFSRRIFRYCSYKHYFAEWAENFPQRKGVNQIGKIYSSKGQAMIDNNFEDKLKIYKTFEYAYNNDVKSFSNPKSLAYYFQTTYDLFNISNAKLK